MKLNDYLKKNKMSQADFAKKLNLNRSMITHYLKKRYKIPYATQLAIEYITSGEVRREDWNDN